MITSVDTNVLLDVFISDAPHHSQSEEWLTNAYDRGAILVCDVVYAELVPAFGDRSSLDRALREINATISPIDTDIAYQAGLRWLQYRPGWWAERPDHLRLPHRCPCGCQCRHLSDKGSWLLRHLLPRVAKTLAIRRTQSWKHKQSLTPAALYARVSSDRAGRGPLRGSPAQGA